MAILEQVENLEEKVDGSSMQVKVSIYNNTKWLNRISLNDLHAYVKCCAIV